MASKRPQDSAFKQQRLRAWQPLLTPKWVIGTFAVTGILFILIGSIMAIIASDLFEKEADYTSCSTSWCPVTIDVTEDLKGPVYVYYKLTNFYQNHRRFVKSRDDKQLRGQASDLDSCDPLKNSQATGYTDKLLYPCGLIATSFFNDEITVSGHSLNTDDIIWESDKDKFKDDPDNIYSSSEFTNRTKRGDETISLPAVNDPHLIVWMRTAGLPTFKKLYGIIEGDVKSGELKFSVKNNFDVTSFGGRKSIVVATTSVLGGKNTFLKWAYIIVGILCLVTAALFAAKHYTNPRKPGDLSYWEKNHAH